MAGMYGSFGDIKKVVGVVAVLLVVSFFLGFGVGVKFGSASPSQETLTQEEKQKIKDAINLSPEQQKQIEDAYKDIGKPSNTSSNAAARVATATPSPTPASSESFAERLKRQREAANK